MTEKVNVEEASSESCDANEAGGRKPKRRWLRFSVRVILIFMTIFAVLIRMCTNDAVREMRGRADFTCPKVEGTIKELKPRWLAQFTPNFLQEWIGKGYFETAKSASVYVYLNPVERRMYHRDQSLDLLGKSLGSLRNLDYLDLRFRGASPHDPIDLSPLSNCVGIRQLELSGANAEIVSDVVLQTNIECLCLNSCTVDSEMISPMLKNETITSLQFNFATIEGDQLKRLSEMKNLTSVHFHSCQPLISEDGLTLKMEVKHMSGGLLDGFVEISSSELKLINAWFERELPGVSISGLH